MTLLAVWLAAGCGAPGGVAVERPAGPALQALVRSELYFGRARPDGSVVSEDEWRAFLAEHVTPRFPAGLTVLDAGGQYRGRSGEIVREPSKIVVLIHEAGPGPAAAIEAIRAAYRRLFDQESVLLIRTSAGVSF